MHDAIIIGAGPLGLTCGIACRRAGLDALIIEKGALVNSFVHYPTDLEFFSTPDLLEIGGIPFTTRNYKPFRAEALDYAMQFGRGLDRDKADRFVEMYVNRWTLDFGTRGRRAVALLLARGHTDGIIPKLVVPRFAS